MAIYYMGKDVRFWLILAILLLIVAIENYRVGTRIDLVIMPVVLSIIFTLNYINMKSEGRFTLKKEHHKKLFLIIFTILLLTVTVIAIARDMGMKVIIVPLVGIIYRSRWLSRSAMASRLS